MELSTGQILEENLVESAFHQILGDVFISQQDNNLKHKARSTLELLIKKTVSGRITVDLNLLENLWQILRMAMIKNQFDKV
uniref:Uncharacterized protein n=1 Tax=Oncorhynchus tshawytscha TaxID=74940 RepID=A0AAZ3NX94_ONCTS